MPLRAIIRPKVPDDLREILGFLETKSPAVADRFAQSVAATLESLVEMPGKGSLKYFRRRRLAGIRSWPVSGFKNYLILYRIVDVGIEVLAVTHGARRLSEILRDRV
jgi:plasmid stabilization system protein ParE